MGPSFQLVVSIDAGVDFIGSISSHALSKSGGKIPVILAHLATVAHAPLAMLFQEAAPTVSFSVMGLWTNMGWLARIVVLIILIMSIR
jgi:hypothetical protein